MAGGDPALVDLAAHEVAVAPLDREIDRRRGTFLATAGLPEVERLAEPALGLADQHDAQARLREPRADGLGDVVDHAHRADGRCR